MILNHNSISAKLYRWFYGTHIMPNNLCPYFWKLVIAYTFALPVLILSLPQIIVSKGKDWDTLANRIIVGIIAYVLLLGAISMLSVFGLFFVLPEKNSWYATMLAIGISLWTISVVVGVPYLINKLLEKWKERRYNRYPEEPKVNIIVEMVKAKYHKYCPKIDWKK